MEFVKNVLTGIFVVAIIILVTMVLRALPEIVFAIVFGGGAILVALAAVIWTLYSIGGIFRGGSDL